MSAFLDELARTMATPMPRRRALRLLGGAVVAIAMPRALRTSRALGATRTAGACPPPGYCPSNTVNCGVCPGARPGTCFLAGCGGPGSTCCCLKDAAGRPSGALLCSPGYHCVPQGSEPCLCDNPCGPVCCRPGEFCANSAQRLCCKEGERGCGPRCCKPNEDCRTIRVGTSSERVCEKRCPQGQAWCGPGKCCPPKWRCANERTGLCKRCRKNEEGCGTKCCNKSTTRCCGKAGCCPKNRSCCVTGKTQRCCPPRQKCAVPILAGDIGIKPGTAAICCPQERYHVSPKLCCPPGQIALTGPGLRIPPPGVSPFCCPRGQICTSGGSDFCADLQSDPANCGSCGHVCESGVCSGGICAFR